MSRQTRRSGGADARKRKRTQKLHKRVRRLRVAVDSGDSTRMVQVIEKLARSGYSNAEARAALQTVGCSIGEIARAMCLWP